MKITYEDKETKINNESIPIKNKVTAENMNEIKNTVNSNDDEVKQIKAILPTTTGTGTDVVLTNTAAMEFVKSPIPMGNTTQDGTLSPDSEVEVETVTGDVEINITDENNTQSQTYPLTLGDIELCKLGDYQDYIYKDNNKWYLHKIIKKIVLDGVNYYINSKNSANTNDFAIAPTLSDSVNINSNNTVANIISSHFEKKSANNIFLNDGTGIAIMTSKNIAIEFTLASEISTKELANEWITNNNVTVYYQLATATETEITNTTIISQLEAIEQATSYEGQTNISGTSNGANPIFNVEAYQSIKLVLAG